MSPGVRLLGQKQRRRRIGWRERALLGIPKSLKYSGSSLDLVRGRLVNLLRSRIAC